MIIKPEFLVNQRPGIYRISFLEHFSGEVIPMENTQRYLEHLQFILDKEKEEKYIASPGDFFQRWINGRIGVKPSLDITGKGFELQIPSINIQRFDEVASHGKLEGVAIASDFGYSGDFGDSMTFALNDFISQRVLVYEDKNCKEIKKRPFGKKLLTQRSIYGFSDKPENFPFESLNSLKSHEYTWSLINIPLENVYSEMKRVGFDWR